MLSPSRRDTAVPPSSPARSLQPPRCSTNTFNRCATLRRSCWCTPYHWRPHHRRVIADQRASPPWSAWADRWGHPVSGCIIENEFFYLQKWLYSAMICLFCVEINRAPKIMKICVISLRCELFSKNIKCYFSVLFECDKNCST